MKIQAKIVLVGNSLGITIPIEIIRANNLSAGDPLDVDLLNLLEKEIKSYECKKCKHQFDSDEDFPDLSCSACGCISVEELDFINIAERGLIEHD